MNQPDFCENVVNSEAWCQACGNEGWVTLKGMIGRYSRGTAACRYCQGGKQRFTYSESAKDNGWWRVHSDTDYSWPDVEPIGQDAAPKLTAAERKANIQRYRDLAARFNRKAAT